MFEVLFSERGLSLERLRVLIEVQDAGSIANTAPGDETRHSQYSRQLRELSEFFGCELTQRSGKELKLTRDGTQLAELISCSEASITSGPQCAQSRGSFDRGDRVETIVSSVLMACFDFCCVRRGEQRCSDVAI